MAKFKTFLKELKEQIDGGAGKEVDISNDKLQTIYDMLDELSDEEISDFAETLYFTFFEEDPDIDEDDEFDLSDLKDMIDSLGNEVYDDIIDLLGPEEFDVEDGEYAEIDEAVGRRLKTKNMNKKTRKFMGLSKTEIRQQKAVRKRAARATKAKRKRYYKVNKMKISSYQKSRDIAIKQGKHKVKLRRPA